MRDQPEYFPFLLVLLTSPHCQLLQASQMLSLFSLSLSLSLSLSQKSGSVLLLVGSGHLFSTLLCYISWSLGIEIQISISERSSGWAINYHLLGAPAVETSLCLCLCSLCLCLLPVCCLCTCACACAYCLSAACVRITGSQFLPELLAPPDKQVAYLLLGVSPIRTLQTVINLCCFFYICQLGVFGIWDIVCKIHSLQCWRGNSSKRPSSNSLITLLKSIYECLIRAGGRKYSRG